MSRSSNGTGANYRSAALVWIGDPRFGPWSARFFDPGAPDLVRIPASGAVLLALLDWDALGGRFFVGRFVSRCRDSDQPAVRCSSHGTASLFTFF
jgi:hypothetical protein